MTAVGFIARRPSALIDAWNGTFGFHRFIEPIDQKTPRFLVDRVMGVRS